MNAHVTAPDQTHSLAQMKVIVGELARVKGRQDTEATLGLYHPDAVLASPPMGSSVQGLAALRQSVEAFFRFAPDYTADLQGFAADGDTLCTWGAISFTPAFSFRGDPTNGARVTTPAFILFRFREQKIVWENFHFDMADLARKAGVPAEAFHSA